MNHWCWYLWRNGRNPNQKTTCSQQTLLMQLVTTCKSEEISQKCTQICMHDRLQSHSVIHSTNLFQMPHSNSRVNYNSFHIPHQQVLYQCNIYQTFFVLNLTATKHWCQHNSPFLMALKFELNLFLMKAI